MGTQRSDNKSNSFIQLVKSPLRFKLFLLKHLPMAFLAGLKIRSANNKQTSVSISLNYFTKNPFQSIYFACLAMAAELSTGILAMNAIEQTDRKFSLLVVRLEAQFTKKATGMITFQSSDGLAMRETLDRCVKKNESEKFIASSSGENEVGELVAEFRITWSFKPK